MTAGPDGAATSSPAEVETAQPPSAEALAQRQGAAPRFPVVRAIVMLLLALVLGVGLTLVAMNALATQRPQLMPFGVTGSSPVVTNAQAAKFAGYPMSFVNTKYTNESDALDAINQGTIYGAYITGKVRDTLLVAPAKSFFASFVIVAAFKGTAKKMHRPLKVQDVKPLPKGKDPFGAVTGLLLLPLIVGGLLSAILVFKATGAAAQHWRIAILLGYAVIGALLTLVIAGPVFGAFAGNRFLPLLPVALLIEVTVALVTAALIALLPGLVAMMLALVLFVVVGLPIAGAGAMMPPYWQAISAALPPHYGSELIQNVLYFSSNGITTAIVVLAIYAVAAWLVLGYLGWLSPRQSNASAPGGPRGRLVLRLVVGALAVVAVEQILFTSNYVSSSHNPVAHNMPIAVVGDSRLTSAVPPGQYKFTSYPNSAAAQTAMGQAKAWAALIAGRRTLLHPRGTTKLVLLNSISDISPLTLAVSFKKAARSLHQKLSLGTYAPKALAAGDPYGLVLSILLTPLLICGYMAATLLRAARGGIAAERYRGLLLLAFGIVTALVLDLIACIWLNGIPRDKFWIAWPIMALIVSVVALFAAVMQRLVGAMGTILTVIVIILFGKPSAGGANGVPYLPDFWRAIGPIFPPRNAYILLRNTIYFGGHGTTEALVVLLAYGVVLGVVIGIFDWRRRPDREVTSMTRETEAQAAAAATPAGVAI